MKTKLGFNKAIHRFQVEVYGTAASTRVEYFDSLDEANERAHQLEGIPYKGPSRGLEPLDAIRCALEWLEVNSPSNAREVLRLALEKASKE